MTARARLTIALVVLAATLGTPAAALAACPQTSVADIEDEVMCPVCGTPLGLATESPQAQRERAFVLDLVEECKSKDEIKDALVVEFGPTVLATPAISGFDAAAYAVPAIAVLVGAGIIGFAVVRWRRRESDPHDLDERPPNAAADDAGRLEAEEEASVEDERKLDRDLRRYDL